jgi:hypothetical protein
VARRDAERHARAERRGVERPAEREWPRAERSRRTDATEVVALGRAGTRWIALLAARGVHDAVAAAASRLSSSQDDEQPSQSSRVAVVALLARIEHAVSAARERAGDAAEARRAIQRSVVALLARIDGAVPAVRHDLARRIAAARYGRVAVFTARVVASRPSPQRSPVSMRHSAEHPSQSSRLPSSHSSVPQTDPSPQPVSMRQRALHPSQSIEVAVVALLARLEPPVAAHGGRRRQLDLDELPAAWLVRPRRLARRTGPDVVVRIELDLAREARAGREREHGEALGRGIEADHGVGVGAVHPHRAVAAVGVEIVGRLRGPEAIGAGHAGRQRVRLPALDRRVEAPELPVP